MNRLNQILAAILALQIVIAAFVFWPASSSTGGEPLFARFEPERVVRVTIQDAEGNRIDLVKGEEGWALPEFGGYPAQADQVSALLVKIADIQTERKVTETSDSHQRLGVAEDNFEGLVQFEMADGERHQLYLGTAPSYNVLHVRADDQDAVYLALGMQLYDVRTEVTAWVEPVYFSVDQDQIVGLTLQNDNGRFVFEKDEAGEWTMAGLGPDESLNPNNVNVLVNRLVSVRMQRPLGQQEQAAYGFDAPQATVTVLTQDAEGREWTDVLRVGALQGEGEEAGYVLKSATSPYYVLVADYVVDDLIIRTRQDFLEQPPTPEPTPTP